MNWPPFKVMLDTNVLFPPLLRDVALRAAEKGLYQPYWSGKILDELENVLARQGQTSAAAAKRARDQIARAFPEALVEGFEHLEPVMANEPGDRHVAAAATLIGAQVIVTANVKDFDGLPQALEIQTPDQFLLCLLDLSPQQMDAILREIAADYKNPPQDVAALLARLNKVAPDFEAAMRARVGTTHGGP